MGYLPAERLELAPVPATLHIVGKSIFVCFAERAVFPAKRLQTGGNALEDLLGVLMSVGEA
ncbi:hypothetical protein SDC9_186667 [bioreactor metagenome]|uniref:Uncharacterized protein n=1 Tax=bioreactor metagenome TaxID=1076179 RepID=A0A645HLL9_9ZZZZ